MTGDEEHSSEEEGGALEKAFQKNVKGMQKEAKKKLNGGKTPILWILIGIGIIVALIIAFIVWWRSYTLIKIVIFILLLWLIRAILMGLFGAKPTTATIASIVICLILMTMVFPATMYAGIQNTGTKAISSLKEGKNLFAVGQPLCYLNLPKIEECAKAGMEGGVIQKTPDLQISFPENIYTPGKAFHISATLNINNPSKEQIKLKPLCYLGTLENPIDSTINGKPEFTSTKTQQVKINCNATADKVQSPHELIIVLERTSKIVSSATVSVSPQSEAGTRGSVEVNTTPASGPYVQSVEFVGDQPFSESQSFKIFLKKQQDFDIKSIDWINITSSDITCDNFNKIENTNRISIMNLAPPELDNYLKSKDTYGFDCVFNIVKDIKQQEAKPFKIETQYTVKKEFKTSLITSSGVA